MKNVNKLLERRNLALVSLAGNIKYQGSVKYYRYNHEHNLLPSTKQIH